MGVYRVILMLGRLATASVYLPAIIRLSKVSTAFNHIYTSFDTSFGLVFYERKRLPDISNIQPP